MQMRSPHWGTRAQRLVQAACAALLLGPAFALAADGLDQALRATLARNPEVRSKLAELESLGYRVKEAEAGRLPSLSVEARTLEDPTSRGLARVQQPLWAFGKIDNNITLAERRAEVGRLELLDLDRRLMEDTCVAYASAYALRRRIAVAQANVEEHQSLYDMISRRRQGGVASDADVRLALSRLTQARAQLDLLNSQLSKSLQDLYALTRVEIAAQAPVPERMARRVPPAQQAADLDAGYVKVRLAQRRLDAVQAEGEVRKSELMPTISARIDHDIQPTTNTVSHTRAGIVFEGHLEGGGLAGSRRLQAEAARLRGAMEDVDAARKEAEHRLVNLQTDLAVQEQMVESQAGVVIAVEETLKSFLRQYDAGRKSWIDVLNTQRELADARQQLEQTRQAQSEAALRMAAMLGYLDPVAGLEQGK